MKVLFCTDGSKISYNSIQNFSKWMKPFVADIICAIDWSFLPDTVAVEDSEFAMQCANSADTILNYTEHFLRECDISIGEKIKMCGSTVDCIIETCEKKDYDFIILGSHGKKGIQKWLGSVSQEVASVSKNSVYISKEKNQRSKVLFAVDNSELSEQMVLKAFEYFDFKDKNVYLTTVYDIPEYLFLEGNLDENWAHDIDNKQQVASLLLLNKFEKIFNDRGINLTDKIVLSGNPATQIVQYAGRVDIDLVVCGTRDRKYLSKLLMSSVSKRILENSKSDVALIKL